MQAQALRIPARLGASSCGRAAREPQACAPAVAEAGALLRFDDRALERLTVAREFTRESKAIAATFAEERAPEHLRRSNGSDFIARAMKGRLSRRGTKARCMDSDSPLQNAFGESSGDKVCAECLALEEFETAAEADVLIAGWRKEYKKARPHSSLRHPTPREYRASWRGRVSLSPACRGGRKRKAFVNRVGVQL